MTYPPSMVASAIALAVQGVPSRMMLAADVITLENVEEYYEPDAA